MKTITISVLLTLLVGCAQNVKAPGNVESNGNPSITTLADLSQFIHRLESSCSDYKDLYPYEQLIQLRDHPNIPDLRIDLRLYNAFSSSSWVRLSREPSCRQAILANMEEGILHSLKYLPKTSFQYNEYYLELAYAKFAQIALSDNIVNEKEFSEADSLIEKYIVNDDGIYQPEHAMPYYFAASKLTDLSRLSNNPVYIKAVLTRSIAISQRGLLKAKNPAELLIALNEANHYLNFHKLHTPSF